MAARRNRNFAFANDKPKLLLNRILTFRKNLDFLPSTFYPRPSTFDIRPSTYDPRHIILDTRPSTKTQTQL